jgi:hypothetical protein
MEAEILFLDPNHVNAGTAALTAQGFDVEVLDWVDPYGPTVWIKARITTDIDDRFMDWVMKLIAPLGGDLVEAGPVDLQAA